MATDIPELQIALKRIERLETQNRTIKRAGAIGLLLVSSLILMGQARQKPRVIQAEKFVLTNSDGIVAATLGFTNDSETPSASRPGLWAAPPGLVFYSYAGDEPQRVQAARFDRSGLRLFDAGTSKERASVSQFGLHFEGQGKLLYQDGTGLFIFNPKGTFVTVAGPGGSASLHASGEGPSVSVWDASEGKAIWRAP